MPSQAGVALARLLLWPRGAMVCGAPSIVCRHHVPCQSTLNRLDLTARPHQLARYRPEERKEKRERLRAEAEARAGGKEGTPAPRSGRWWSSTASTMWCS